MDGSIVFAPVLFDGDMPNEIFEWQSDIVPPQAFHPAPKITSSFVRLLPLHPLPHIAQDPAIFAKIVAAAFSTRRKTLRNTLKTHLSDQDFAALGIDAGLRAENLGVADFVRIANFVQAAHVSR